MRLLSYGATLFMLLNAVVATAQGLPGRYESTFTMDVGRRPQNQTLNLEINSNDNGKVTGKLNVSKFSCQGDYTVMGTHQGDNLELTTSAGVVQGCGNVALTLTVQGNKLVGKYGPFAVEFIKK